MARRKKQQAVEPELPPIPTVEELREQMRSDPEKFNAAYHGILAMAAGAMDNPSGFAAFYELIHGNQAPADALRWIETIYRAHDEGVGALIWAWRGSWKSTTISVTFLAFRIGHEPEKTNLVISANDDTADKITAAIAAIIEHNPAWKLAFPHVTPDKERGWGAEGYWVKDERLPYEEWAAKQASVIDPTLLGAGYTSSRLIGKHPSGVLNIDDIHDERNSISDRERAHVVRVVSDTILPMALKDNDRLITWEIVVGTPWAEDDAYHYLKNTGQFEFIRAPIGEIVDEGTPGAVYVDGRNRDGVVFTDIVGWWMLTRPEAYGAKAIVRERATSGLRGFARMYKLDLKAANIAGLKYYTYPHEKIDLERWETGGGADLATVIEKGLRDDPGRDKFSHAYGVKTPLGQLVVFDGVIEQCTQAQAEDHLKRPQTVFKRWRHTVLEGDGMGETFYISLLRRNPTLRVMMQKTRGRSKRYRQEQEMGPWLERGVVLISDADTPYLNQLRQALDKFPEGNNDIRDGLYWLCKAFPEVLQMPAEEDELPVPEARKKKKMNPYLAFGSAYENQRF